MRGSSARSPQTARCWRPRRPRSACSSTTRSGLRGAISASTRAAAGCSRAGRLETAVAGIGLAFAAAGGFGLLAEQPAADATRFGHVTEATAIVAAAGVCAALLSLRLPALGLAASVAGVLVLAGPTLAGHALD